MFFGRMASAVRFFDFLNEEEIDLKKHYNEPETELLEFDSTDILTTSGDSDTSTETDENWTPFEPNQP